ncbi:MAG: PUA domain-containing protein [Pyrobaculum sp.]
MKRIRLSNREIKELRESYKFAAPIMSSVDTVEIVLLTEKEAIILIDGEPLLSKVSVKDLGEFIIPSLYLIHKSPKGALLPPFPKAVVDAGAVKRIIDGADVMRPGIRKLEGEFNKGDTVFVVDEKGRAIAIAVALHSSGEIQQMEKGKVLLNLHYLGDRIWRASLELAKKAS